ncbi:hypothetical protein BI364_04750 [Acidihalobacter yilgarnensis]|uniref:Ni,Fe-hydrogenase I large subunit n=1 Tax=Acidihalobacter yilgarnensis TaxID=2819280 RepID=A0A1D8ILQ4_9GAMM|nr:nickel-dependent hydrogenase large subunit [Acidihalobacter yilgarnensis]AOU97389.1 hypothetical protein BI364_04750 [Acidihalobacter yilgarnensis]
MSAPHAVDPAGRLHIVLEHDAAGIVAVDIRSTRPAYASRALIGRTPAEAVRLAPLLFSLCGGAQRVAALAACADAQGIEATPAERDARGFALELERVREHALRLLMDWPQALGLEAWRDDAAQLFALHRRMADAGEDGLQATREASRALEAFVRRRVLSDVASWTALTETDGEADGTGQTALERLLRRLAACGWQALGAGTGSVPLEAFDQAEWRSRLAHAAASYALFPHIDGEARETTPYSRQREAPAVAAATRRWGEGLIARLLALACELDFSLAKLQDYLERSVDVSPPQAAEGAPDASGEGIGIVQAARGQLIHRVSLSQGRIRDYRIVAPTEWNFHPRAAAARALSRLPFRDAESCAAQARALICAVDPCVEYELDIRRHA